MLHEHGVLIFFEFGIVAWITMFLDPGAAIALVVDNEHAVLGRNHTVSATDATSNHTLIDPFVLHVYAICARQPPNDEAVCVIFRRLEKLLAVFSVVQRHPESWHLWHSDTVGVSENLSTYIHSHKHTSV